MPAPRILSPVARESLPERGGANDSSPCGPAAGPTRGRLLVAAGVVVATALLFLPFHRLGVDRHHDGLMLKTALDVKGGQVLFRDTFTQYGALTSWIQAGWLALTGGGLASLRLSTVVAYAFSAGALFLAWRTILPTRLALAAWGGWLLMVPFVEREWYLLPWSSVWGLLFQSLSLLAFLAVLEPRAGKAPLPIAGALAALAFWCRPPVGVFLTAALLVALALVAWHGRWPRRKFAASGAALVAGSLVVHGGLLLVVVATGGFAGWVEQTWLWPARFVASRGLDPEAVVSCLLGYRSYGNPALLVVAVVVLAARLVVARERLLGWRVAPGSTASRALAAGAVAVAAMAAGFGQLRNPSEWAYFVPVSLAVALVARLARAARSAEGEPAGDRTAWLAFAVVVVVALASWTQYYPVRCPRHTFWGVSPAIGPFVFLVWKVSGLREGRALALVALLLSPLAIERTSLAVARLREPTWPIEDAASSLAGMRLPSKEDRDDLDRISRALGSWLDANPGKPVALYGIDALHLTFARNLENPDPVFVTWKELEGEERVRRREQWVARRRPALVVERRTAGSLAPERFRRDLGYRTLETVRRFDLELLVPLESRDARPGTGTSSGPR